ncbi:Abi family protein [Bacillus cereus]|uniref:Abi family protein n=1 Tax=Bacillus cereus TaxID=1396 RepID=UPI0010BE09A8|nr:Abi family protein [Bacillus cereus]TKH82328.1 Abi family protein [Bacillus cereus]
MSNTDVPLNIEDQILLMKSYVTFRQKTKIRRLLQKEGYFRISRYGKQLLSFTNLLRSKPNQELLFAIYDFDLALREIFYRYTQKAEIQLKNYIANAVSLHLQDPTFYLDQNSYTPSRGEKDRIKKQKNRKFFKRVFQDIVQSEKKLRIAQNKYPEFSSYRGTGPRSRKRIPAWAAFMYFDFGTIMHIYAYLKLDLRKEILRFGYPNTQRNISKIDTQNMDTWIDAIRNLRNICSHHNKLVGKTSSVVHLDKNFDSPNLLPNNTDLFSRMYALKKILHTDDSEALKKEVKKLINRSKLNVYQFNILPQNWETLYDSIHNF